MDASVVYQIVQALSKEEQMRLYNMMKEDVIPKIRRKGNKHFKFTREDAREYLINNVFNKVREP